MKRPELYVSVDTEASGPIPGEYSLLSIGACIVGNTDKSFYAELKPISMSATPSALAVTKFKMDTQLEIGLEPIEALRSFEEWIKNRTANDTLRPVMVGFNAPFDWTYINWYFLKYLQRNIFGICPIDIKSYMMGMCKILWGETTKRKMPKIFKSNLPHTHNALDDAKEQAEIFENLLKENNQFNEYISKYDPS